MKLRKRPAVDPHPSSDQSEKRMKTNQGSASAMRGSEKQDKQASGPSHQSISQPTAATSRVESTANPNANVQRSNRPKKPRWTKEERLWISCYYQLLLYRLSHHPSIAPEDTVICIAFNAYFQARSANRTQRYPYRRFFDFEKKARREFARTIKQVTMKSFRNAMDRSAFEEFVPVITPEILQDYTQIHDTSCVARHLNFLDTAVTAQLHAFLDRTVTQIADQQAAEQRAAEERAAETRATRGSSEWLSYEERIGRPERPRMQMRDFGHDEDSVRDGGPGIRRRNRARADWQKHLDAGGNTDGYITFSNEWGEMERMATR